jgi:hypothetical protein
MSTFAYWAFALLIFYLCLAACLPSIGRALARISERDTSEYGEH